MSNGIELGPRIGPHLIPRRFTCILRSPGLYIAARATISPLLCPNPARSGELAVQFSVRDGMRIDASGNIQSAFYRLKAEEAVEFAEESKDPLMRVAWLELAERWAKLIPPEEPDLQASEQRFEQRKRNRGAGQDRSNSGN